jgi:hypothetical protein
MLGAIFTSFATETNYDDAMAYINLLTRERGQLSETEDEYQAAIATAELWVQRALDARKRKAEARAKEYNPHALDNWEIMKTAPGVASDAPGLTPDKLKRMREAFVLQMAGAMHEQRNPVSFRIQGHDHDILQIEWGQMDAQFIDVLLKEFVVADSNFFNGLRFMRFQALEFTGPTFTRRLYQSDFLRYCQGYEAYERAVVENLKRLVDQKP